MKQPWCTWSSAGHSVRAPVLAAAISPDVDTVTVIRAGLTWVGLVEHVFVQKVPERGGERKN